jgi:hypothetical protein
MVWRSESERMVGGWAKQGQFEEVLKVGFE